MPLLLPPHKGSAEDHGCLSCDKTPQLAGSQVTGYTGIGTAFLFSFFADSEVDGLLCQLVCARAVRFGCVMGDSD